mmetsp:Transcript_33437/g.73375  ORF Transcript_33437/g.73375 Transcript_33437/m.73375 type:complete len:324 (+) Transcript_33437:734-1705(+)
MAPLGYSQAQHDAAGGVPQDECRRAAQRTQEALQRPLLRLARARARVEGAVAALQPAHRPLPQAARPERQGHPRRAAHARRRSNVAAAAAAARAGALQLRAWLGRADDAVRGHLFDGRVQPAASLPRLERAGRHGDRTDRLLALQRALVGAAAVARVGRGGCRHLPAAGQRVRGAAAAAGDAGVAAALDDAPLTRAARHAGCRRRREGTCKLVLLGEGLGRAPRARPARQLHQRQGRGGAGGCADAPWRRAQARGAQPGPQPSRRSRRDGAVRGLRAGRGAAAARPRARVVHGRPGGGRHRAGGAKRQAQEDDRPGSGAQLGL